MSRPGGPPGPEGSEPCGCDPEKVFELVDGSGGRGGLDPDQEQELHWHLASCPRCRELYERELNMNAFLSSFHFPVASPRSVCQGVAMALPTRSLRARLLWSLLASALLVVAFASLEFKGTKPVVLAISTLGTYWDFVVGSARVAHAILAAAAPTILLVLALGALADLLIAFLVLSVSRYRRAREA